MATRLYPDRFTEVDLRAEIDAFYTELYSLDAETIETEIMPLLVGDIAP
jgi:hypothetical protein